MNDLRKKILESDFYKNAYANQSLDSIDLYVSSIQAGLEETSAIFQCPLYEISHEVLESASSGILGIGNKLHYIRYTRIIYAKKVLVKADRVYDYIDSLTSGTLNIDDEILSKPTEVNVRVKRDGIFIKIAPPQGDGKKITDILLIEKELNNVQALSYDIDVIKKASNEQTGEYIQIADWNEGNALNNGSVRINVSNDYMRVFMNITPPTEGGREIDLQDIKELLKTEEVIFGIKEDIIEEALENRIYKSPIIIAEGTAPISGKNAKIEYLINMDKESMSRYIDDVQSIDYKNMSIVENIAKDQPIAKKIDVQYGEEGYTVLGKTIEVVDGKDIEIDDYLGNNVVFDEATSSILASADGQVVITGKKINVEPLLEIASDVGPETGNIDFLGSVLIRGSVLDNYSVRANGNIEVLGSVEKCNIEAKGDIIVKLGIQGHGEGKIKSEGDVIAKFIQFANIHAGGNVIVTEAILNSNVDADDSILLTGKKAMASGGHLRAYNEVNAKTLGSPSAVKTIIETGVLPATRRKLEKLRLEKKEINEMLEELTKNIKSLEKLEKYNKLDENQKVLLKEYRDKNNEAMIRVKEISEEKSKLILEIQSTDVHSKVAASKEALPGVTISIRNADIALRDSYKATTFYEDSGMIQLSNYQETTTNKVYTESKSE